MDDDGIQVLFDTGSKNQQTQQQTQAQQGGVNEKQLKKKLKYQNKFLKKKGQTENFGKTLGGIMKGNNRQQQRKNDGNQNSQQQQQMHKKRKDSLLDDDFGLENQNLDGDQQNQQEGGVNGIQKKKISKEQFKQSQPKKPERASDKYVQKLSRDRKYAKVQGKQASKEQTQSMDVEEGQVFQMQEIEDNIETEIFAATKFEEIEDLNNKIKSSLKEQKFEMLTNIQQQSYKQIQSGENVAIKSETGSGKTLAYLVPLLNDLLNQPEKINRSQGTLIIVVCPTRELSIQCEDQAQKLLHWANNIICGDLVGGENPQKEKAKLRKGVSVLFATPGRLVYHLKNTQSFKFDNLKSIVFEESDRTLDLGFKKDLEEMIDILNKKIEFEKIQKILISAHFSEQIEKLYLRMSKKHCRYVGFSNESQVELNEEMDNEYIQIDKNVSIPKKLKQYYTVVFEQQKIQFLITYLYKLQNTKTIVFLSTCSQVEYFEMILFEMKFKNQNGEDTDQRVLKDMEIYKLHGNIEQKQRTKTYFDFKNTKSGAVLLSTDVAARGLDFPEVTHTVLYEVPNNLVDYCNRIGRTARINKKGVSLLILNKPEEEFANKLIDNGLDLNYFDCKLIFDFFGKMLKNEFQIGSYADTYLQGLTSGVLKKSKERLALARSAYVSSLRAYARLTDRTIFRVKALNLQAVAKSYGLQNVKSKDKETKSTEYQEKLEKFHKNKLLQDRLADKFSKKGVRKAVDINSTIKSEFM